MQGLETKILQEPVKPGEMKFSIKPAEEGLLEKHLAKYKDNICLKADWRELLLVLEGENSYIGFDNMHFLTTSSYHVQAYKRNAAPGITVLGVTGLMLTKDNQFVYGIRAGEVGVGRADIVPGGHLSAETKLEDPVFDGFYQELVEELGIQKQEVSDLRIIGWYRDPVNVKATCFLLHGNIDINSYELDEMHRRAFSVYEFMKKQGMPEARARASIKEAGFPNEHAWEHSKLLFVDNDPDLISMIIRTKEVKHKEEHYTLWNSGIAPLMIYEQIRR